MSDLPWDKVTLDPLYTFGCFGGWFTPNQSDDQVSCYAIPESQARAGFEGAKEILSTILLCGGTSAGLKQRKFNVNDEGKFLKALTKLKEFIGE